MITIFHNYPLDFYSYSTEEGPISNKDIIKEDHIELEVPGYSPEDIEVQVNGLKLTVSGKLKGREFYREYILSSKVDVDVIQVTVDKGLLTISLPLKAGNEPRKLQVRGPG
jgi:HSP20 family molecular chaperone IbpA